MQLLAAVSDVVPTGARAAFDAQVAAITRVQRSPPSWSEIAFYRKRWGRANWSGVPLFPRTGEFRLAEVRFAVAGRRFTSTLTCIRGHVFDFATSPGPRAVAFAQWDRAGTARLLADPLQPIAIAREAEVLPPAWAEVLRRLGGSGRGGWHVHDDASAYRVALDDGVYLVLAERDGDQFVLHRLEPPAEGFFLLPHHDGVPEPIGQSVESLLGAET
jgi:hypothetical protein